MKRLLQCATLIAAVALAGCRDQGVDAVGVFVLQTIDGKSLPVPVPGTTSSYVGAEITLLADHTGTERTWTANSTQIWATVLEGTWKLEGSTLTLPNGNPAVLTNSTLTFNGWVYKKQ